MEKDLETYSKEALRQQVWELHQQGTTKLEISTRLNLSYGTVSLWCQRGDSGGPNTFKNIPRNTPRSLLSPEQWQQLLTILEGGASTYGFVGDFWTGKRVQAIIFIIFGVSCAIGTAGDMLRKTPYHGQHTNWQTRGDDLCIHQLLRQQEQQRRQHE